MAERAEMTAGLSTLPFSPSKDTFEELVERVKSLCRSGPKAKVLWRSWCDCNAEGTKDPNLMDELMLRSFFDAYDSGTIQPAEQAISDKLLSATKGSTDAEDLATVVNMGQKISPSWKAAWVMYCQQMGKRSFDPSRHQKEFLQVFLESCGQCALQATGSEPVRSFEDDPFRMPPHDPFRMPPPDAFKPPLPEMGFPAPDLSAPGFPAPGFPALGFPRRASPEMGLPAPGLSAPGFPALGFPALGFPRRASPEMGLPAPGLSAPGFPARGSPAGAVPRPTKRPRTL